MYDPNCVGFFIYTMLFYGINNIQNLKDEEHFFFISLKITIKQINYLIKKYVSHSNYPKSISFKIIPVGKLYSRTANKVPDTLTLRNNSTFQKDWRCLLSIQNHAKIT